MSKSGGKWEEFGKGQLKREKCPVCGRGSWCCKGGEGFFWCARSHGEQVPGLVRIHEKGQPDVSCCKLGWLYRDEGLDQRDRDDSDEARARRQKMAEERAAEREAERRKAVKRAAHAWGVAKDKDPALALEYFANRGIDGATLPRSIRVDPDCEYWVETDDGWTCLGKWPCILGAIAGADNTVHGLQRIYLERDRPARKRGDHPLPGGAIGGAGERQDPKKTMGDPGGGAVRLNAVGDGLLVLCEGIETGMALRRALGAATGVWACVSTSGLKAIEIPPGWISAGYLKRVVIAADCDEWKHTLDAAGNPVPGRSRRPGQDAAAEACVRLRRLFPSLLIGWTAPSEAGAPGLVTAEGVPAQGKSVDWLDVYARFGAEVVERAIRGCECEAGNPAATAGGGLGERDPEADEKGKGSPEWGSRYKPIPRDNLRRGRLVLERMFRPDEAAGGRWHLARWKRDWYVYYPARGVWEKIDDELLGADVRAELSPMFTESKNGDGIELCPTERIVGDILKAMIVETAVWAPSVPAWLPASHDAEASPLWRTAGRIYRREETPKVRPASIIAFPDGLLDVEEAVNGRLSVQPPSPRWFSTTVLPFRVPREALADVVKSPVDEVPASVAALCPEFLKFVEWASGADADWIECVQQIFGYLLTADNTRKKIPFFLGPKDSGKSTMIFAQECCVGKDNCVNASLTTCTNTFEMAGWVGKLVVRFPELEVGKYADPVHACEIMKTVSGGDRQSIERKNVDREHNADLNCRFLLAGNSLPRLPDSSGAFAGRLIVLPFTEVYSGTMDGSLLKAIEREAPGIMAWALQGLMNLRRRGSFVETTDGRAKRLEYQALNAPVWGFTQEETVTGVGQGVVTTVLFERYKLWAKAHGHSDELSLATFGSHLHSCLAGIKREQCTVDGERRRVYMGIRPLYDGEPAELKPGQQRLRCVVTREEQLKAGYAHACDQLGFDDGAGQ